MNYSTLRASLEGQPHVLVNWADTANCGERLSRPHPTRQFSSHLFYGTRHKYKLDIDPLGYTGSRSELNVE